MKIHNPLPCHIPQLRNLWKEAFGDTDEFLDIFFSTAFSSDRSLCITIDQKAVAALYWFDCTVAHQKIAYIYAVATAKSHRGQGLCKMLMEAAHSILRKSNYSGALLVPAQSSLFSFYEKMGYKTTCYTDNLQFSATGEKISVNEISKEEFAAVRKKLLPENSVLQEKENLDFLHSYANFYKGEDFLAAAYKENDRLIVKEFLGNKEKMAALIKSMGCVEGVFRTPGATTPYAMYLPLTDDPIIPSYFGFSFD